MENEEEMAKEKETDQSGIREIKREAYILERNSSVSIAAESSSKT